MRGLKGLGKGVKKGARTLANLMDSMSPDDIPNPQSESPNSTNDGNNDGGNNEKDSQPNDSLDPKHNEPPVNSDNSIVTPNPKKTKLDFKNRNFN